MNKKAEQEASNLDAFLRDYALDDNSWYRLDSGEHQMYFDALLERYTKLKKASNIFVNIAFLRDTCGSSVLNDNAWAEVLVSMIRLTDDADAE